MMEIFSAHPLPNRRPQNYAGIAFDGCRYYLTVECQNKIMVLDQTFCQTECIETRRAYNAICYDMEENCFWAASNACYGTLYKLSACLQEVDRLSIKLPCGCASIITGVSVCCGEPCLLISAGEQIYRVEKQECCVGVLYRAPNGAQLSSVICAPPFVFCIALHNKIQTLLALAPDGETVGEMPIPGDFCAVSGLLYPCKSHCGTYHLSLLGTKHFCYPYVLDIGLARCISEAICPCCGALCRKQCGPICHGGGCREQSCNDILESIALQEAALAHILNAEGEKIQKAVAESTNVCDLLAVNASVQKTIARTTYLEQVLHAKLETVNECYENHGDSCPLPGPSDGPCKNCTPCFGPTLPTEQEWAE